MKKNRFSILRAKAGILISLLTFLGFAACEEDVQPEYGVPAVRDKAVKVEQQKNDSTVKSSLSYSSQSTAQKTLVQ